MAVYGKYIYGYSFYRLIILLSIFVDQFANFAVVNKINICHFVVMT